MCRVMCVRVVLCVCAVRVFALDCVVFDVDGSFCGRIGVACVILAHASDYGGTGNSTSKPSLFVFLVSCSSSFTFIHLHSCSFSFALIRSVLYNNWSTLVSTLRGFGIRVMTYINPMLADVSTKQPPAKHNYFAIAKQQGYLVTLNSGEVWIGYNGAGLVDFTNPVCSF